MSDENIVHKTCNHNSANQNISKCLLSINVRDDWAKTNGFSFQVKGNKLMPQTLIFIYYIFVTWCCRPLILKFQCFKQNVD